MSKFPEDSASKVKLQNNIIQHLRNSDVPKIKGIGETIFQCMKGNGNNIAQIDALTGVTETSNHFLQKCVRTAMHLQSMGITPGDIVTTCTFNHLDTFVPIVAAWFVGAKVANTAPQLSLSDTKHLLKLVRPKIIFVSTNAIDLIEKAVEQGDLDVKIVVFGKTETHIQFKDLTKTVKGEEEFIPFTVKNVKETALIAFSSGTTGSPKGICVHHYGLLVSIFDSLQSSDTKNLVFMTSSTPYWLSAIIFFLRCTISCFTSVIVPEFSASEMWNWIRKYKVNMVFLATAQWISLTKYGRPHDAATNSLMAGILGGASVSKAQMFAIRNIFPGSLIVSGYSLSEFGGSVFGLHPLSDPVMVKTYSENPHSLGRNPLGTECKVVDLETEELLGPGKKGELRVKSEFLMNGYYNADSTGAWDSDGFLKTGDLVYYDEDLCFYYVDRIKDMLKYRSWQVAPVELEAVITSHPCVKNVIVVGIPHSEDGDHPVAIVELLKPVTEEEIVKFVDDLVADSHRLRGGVKFIDKIPLSPNGKNQRMYVKNRLLRGEI